VAARRRPAAGGEVVRWGSAPVPLEQWWSGRGVAWECDGAQAGVNLSQGRPEGGVPQWTGHGGDKKARGARREAKAKP
jgi:hypothetical protein